MPYHQQFVLAATTKIMAHIDVLKTLTLPWQSRLLIPNTSGFNFPRDIMSYFLSFFTVFQCFIVQRNCHSNFCSYQNNKNQCLSQLPDPSIMLNYGRVSSLVNYMSMVSAVPQVLVLGSLTFICIGILALSKDWTHFNVFYISFLHTNTM